MNYLLDTNIIINLVRNDTFFEYFNVNFRNNDNLLITSVVTVGELESFTMQRQWGRSKKEALAQILNSIIVYPIRVQQIINKYAEIDAFSQGKHPSVRLNQSSRNMGNPDNYRENYGLQRQPVFMI